MEMRGHLKEAPFLEVEAVHLKEVKEVPFLEEEVVHLKVVQAALIQE